MKVLLINDTAKNKKGDIIEVAEGFARYLLSKQIAVKADKRTLDKVAVKKSVIEGLHKIELEKAEEIFNKINMQTIKIVGSLGEIGKLHGAITSEKISKAIEKEFQITINKHNFSFENGRRDIRRLGIHKVYIKLHRDVIARVLVNVILPPNEAFK
ncbi:MAG: 50S ribosomal protein L9 [Firmicutes bacterium]|nr:50S ribosomal protein L9 [Bacillota bacterium]